MKQFFFGLTLIALPLTAVSAKPASGSAQLKAEAKSGFDKPNSLSSPAAVQTNLIGEVTAIDQSAGKIVVQTEAKTFVKITVGEKTVFRRVAPGQTSLAGAEQITVADVKVGDRVLIPGGVAAEQTAVRQFIVMAREAISAQRDKERENRRARTINGRVTAVNLEKKEIIIQARGREQAEALTVTASGKVKLLRYAPDSLKPADAVAGAFADLRVGDQIRVVGDKSADGKRVSAEEIFSGSVSRAVGTISEINASRGEVVVKNVQTGQSMTVAVGKNTTLRRITPEVADALKQRFERRRERRAERTAGGAEQPPQQQTQDRENRRRNRAERRNRANGEGNQNNQANNQNNNQGGNEARNRNPQQMFENLPPIKIADLKKGDAVLITATAGGNAQITAVSIVTGAAEMQQILQQTQGGRRGQGNMSPGLPGNVGGGNAGSGDDDPRR